MTADLPWANQSLGSLISLPYDIQPDAYSLFYVNMNMGSTYLIPLILVTIFTFGVVLGYADDGIHNRPLLTYVFQNFF